MGHILEPISGVTHILGSHEVLGRSRGSSIRVDHGSVSATHAVLQWSGMAWVLRDAASLNGTRVDGRVVGPGDALPLREGSQIVLGDAPALVLRDAGPPVPFARDEDDVLVVGKGGVLALGDAEEPTVVVVAEPRRQRWWAERADHRAPVEDGDIVEVDGTRWRLRLPELLEPTARLDDRVLLREFSAELVVSRDQEHVDITLHCGPRRWLLEPRSHHYTLYVLARARLDDAGRGIAASEQGWVHRDDLLRQLRISQNLLHTHIFRARREVAALGVPDAPDVIERRETGQLRLGFVDVDITDQARPT